MKTCHSCGIGKLIRRSHVGKSVSYSGAIVIFPDLPIETCDDRAAIWISGSDVDIISQSFEEQRLIWLAKQGNSTQKQEIEHLEEEEKK